MRTSAASLPYPSAKSNTAPSGNAPFRIIGVACTVAFFIDMLIIGVGPNMGTLEWRVQFMQSLGDRSIVFLLGTAFLMMGLAEMRSLRKTLSTACLGIGMGFILMTLLSIWDASTLQKQATSNLTTQTSQLEQQIQKTKDQEVQGSKITAEQVQQALDRLSNESASAQKNTTTQVIKTGASSAGNLMVVGVGMIALGRYGTRR
jgi:predicted PurR-regulated permease PerM